MKHKSICGIILGAVLLAVSSVAAAGQLIYDRDPVFFHWSPFVSMTDQSQQVHSWQQEDNIYVFTQHGLTFSEYYFTFFPVEEPRPHKHQNAKVFEGIQGL